MISQDRLAERLGLKELQLRTLLEVTKAVNNNLGRPDLLQLYETVLREQLGITKAVLYEHTGTWRRLLAFPSTDLPLTAEVQRLFDGVRDIQVITPEMESQLGGFDVAVPVFHRERPLALLLIGDLDEGEVRISPTVKHLNFVQTLTNVIAVALENKRLAEQALEQERDRRELELAAEMQGMLVPRDLPNDDLLDCAAWYQPHQQVGGDYYDLIRTAPHELTVAIADVSGKGISAALLMSNFQATLRALVRYGQSGLDEAVKDLNDTVHGTARGERFITLFLAKCDLRSRRMRYVNAGHNAPLLHNLLGDPLELTTGTIGLGMMKDLPFLRVGEAEILPGCALMTYTDGLVEQENPELEPFGTGPLIQVLRSASNKSALALNDSVTAALQHHRRGSAFLDDIALLTVRFR
jgi:phosphoserine phosphatase RsbU/P